MSLRLSAVRLLNRVPPDIARRFDGSSRAASLARPIMNLLVPSGLSEVTVRSGRGEGIRLEIDLRSEKYYWTGTYERELIAQLARDLRPGSVFWDVGAHVGYVTAIASRLVGPSGRVIAFEPLPANLARLRLTVEKNALDNVLVRPVAVASAPGTLPFHVHPSSSMGSLLPSVDEVEVAAVEATSLDAEAETNLPPTLIKIDVEGAEAEVLDGAMRLIAQVHPALIVECLSGDAIRDVTERLPGYRSRPLDRTNYYWEPIP